METLVVLATILAVVAYTFRELFYADILKLELAPLGFHHRPVKNDVVNLDEYMIDKKGNLYSKNSLTWEVNKRFDKDMLICSNNSTNNNGEIVNTLRDIRGRKHTVVRNDLSFSTLKGLNGSWSIVAKKKGDRHLTVSSTKYNESKYVI